MSFGRWLTQNAATVTGISIVLFIPYWVVISNLWEVISGGHISLQAFLIIQVLNLLALLATQYFLYKSFRGEKQFSYSKIWQRVHSPVLEWLDHRRQLRQQTQAPSERTITVPNVGEVHLCCYNAARLKDTCCMCGRAIPEELIAYFDF